MKKYIKSYLSVVIQVLIITLILSLFSYLDFISNKVYGYLELISVLLILYFNGKILGNRKDTYSFLEGVKLGIFVLLILILINLLFVHTFNSRLLIYYIMIILIPILGSMKKVKKR